jgi:hypothetical protein
MCNLQVGETFWQPASLHIAACQDELLAGPSTDRAAVSQLSQLYQAQEVALALGQGRWLQLGPELLVAATQAMVVQARMLATTSRVGWAPGGQPLPGL